MFGKSNNITLAPAKNTFLHRHLHGNNNGTTTTGPVVGGGRRYGISGTLSGRKCAGAYFHHHHLTARRTLPSEPPSGRHNNNNLRQNVAIATQVLNPSAIGSLTGNHKKRLITTTTGFSGRGFMRNSSVDDDYEDSLLGERSRRRRARRCCCSWSKFGCYGGSVLACVFVMTVVILAVGYLQAEKERVFNSPAKFAQRNFPSRHKPRILEEIDEYSSVNEILDSEEATGQVKSHKNGSSFSSEDYDDHQNSSKHQAISASQETDSGELESNYDSKFPIMGHKNTWKHIGSNILDDNDFLNEISEFPQLSPNQEFQEHYNPHQPKNYNDALSHSSTFAPDDQDYTLHQQQQGDQLNLQEHSPPAEVKVLPPKDFNPFNNQQTSSAEIQAAEEEEEASSQSHQQQQGNKSNNSNDNNEFSFTIPIYATMDPNTHNNMNAVNTNSTGASTAETAAEILHSFTFPSSSSTTINPFITANSNANAPFPDLPNDSNNTTGTIANIPAVLEDALLNNPYIITTPSSSSSSQHPSNELLLKDNFQELTDLDLLNGNGKNIPSTAKLQTDLFDDESSNEDATVTVEGTNSNQSHIYSKIDQQVKRGPNPPAGGTGTGHNRLYKEHFQTQQQPRNYDKYKPNSDSNYPSRIITVHGKVGYQGTQPPPKIRVQDRTYTPRPGSVTATPADRPKFKHATTTVKPKHFPVKTTSTSSSFSKLYEFQDSLTTQNPNHNYNSKVEYITIGNNNGPISNQENDRDYSHSSVGYGFTDQRGGTSVPTINTPPTPVNPTPYLQSFPPHMAHSNPYLIDFSHTATPMPSSQISQDHFSTDKLKPLNTYILNSAAYGGGVGAPLNSPSTSVTTTAVHNYGIATNAHLGAISDFDNFDFSKFLTKRPDPNPSNNYNGGVMFSTPATTFPMPATSTSSSSGAAGDDSQLITKRTFFLPNSPATSSLAAVGQFSLANMLGTTSPYGAAVSTNAGAVSPGLNLYQNNFVDYNTGNTVNNGNSEILPSGSVPIDLASSYIPAGGQFTVASSNYRPNSYNNDPLINYNDPTSALTRYLPNGPAAVVATGGNYNTITQGMHLLSLLSGNIPQHLLSQAAATNDLQASSSSISEQHLEESKSEGSRGPFNYGGGSPEGRSLTSSSIPDQIGSFSQNILRQLVKSTRSKYSKDAPIKPPTPKTMDILSILGLNNAAAAGKSSRSSSSEEITAQASPSLVKKASAILQDLDHRDIQTPTLQDKTSAALLFGSRHLKKFGKGLKSGFFT